MAMMMKEYHALENLLGEGLRRQDAEKMQRIRQVLSDAYKEQSKPYWKNKLGVR